MSCTNKLRTHLQIAQETLLQGSNNQNGPVIMDTFFGLAAANGEGAAKLRRWITRRLRDHYKDKYSLANISHLVVPVNFPGLHWGLVVLDFVQEHVEILDSLSGGLASSTKYLDTIESLLTFCTSDSGCDIGSASGLSNKWTTQAIRQVKQERKTATQQRIETWSGRSQTTNPSCSSTSQQPCTTISSDDLWTMVVPPNLEPEPRKEITAAMRKEVVASIKENHMDREFASQLQQMRNSDLGQEHLTPSERDHDEDNVDTYVARMGKDGEYGAEMEMRIMSNLIGCPVLVYTYNETTNSVNTHTHAQQANIVTNKFKCTLQMLHNIHTYNECPLLGRSKAPPQPQPDRKRTVCAAAPSSLLSAGTRQSGKPDQRHASRESTTAHAATPIRPDFSAVFCHHCSGHGQLHVRVRSFPPSHARNGLCRGHLVQNHQTL